MLNGIEIREGDCRELLKAMPERSVHCVVTSPPYWGLRDYHVDGQFGLEPTPDEFISNMVDVFRHVRRVLRDDGVCWVNMGDAYASSGGPTTAQSGDEFSGRRRGQEVICRPARCRTGIDIAKVGDLMNMPHRLAEALRADGWYWRSTLIWSKRSPMPESISGWRWLQCRVKVGRQPVAQGGLSSWDMGEHSHGPNSGAYRGQEKTVPVWEPCSGCDDCRETNGLVLRRGKWRPTTSHEYVFLLTKSESYFCDGEAVAEKASANTHDRGKKRKPPKEAANYDAGNGHQDWCSYVGGRVETRNPRSVLTLSSEPYRQAHFATFPSALPKFCIEASTSNVGCCRSCGACYAPIVETERVATRPGIDNKIWKHQEANGPAKRSSTSPNLDPQRHIVVKSVRGHLPTCHCNAGDPVPCTVLDPFSGAGTTGLVCYRLHRNYIGLELNPEYAAMSRRRIQEEMDKHVLFNQSDSA